MKKYELTCIYMGRTTTETVGEAELRDIWTLVGMGEDVGKCAGEFEDADGPKSFDECPLDWKEGQAAETGCGPWWGGFEDGTVMFCDGLLVRAGLPRLTVMAGDLAATFDTEGVNAELLDALDRAEWTLAMLPDDTPPG